MKYEIKKIDRNITWGVLEKTSGKYKPKYENCFDKWTPGLNRTTGVLQTGLTTEDEKYFEEKLQLIPGTLRRDSAYWDNFIIVIPDKGLDLYDENPLHEFFLKLLKADPEVSPSLQDAMVNPRAIYVIITEAGEAKIKNKQRETLKKAYILFDGMTESDISDALHLLGKDPSGTDNEVCANILGEYLEENPDKFLEMFSDEELKSKVWIIKLIRLGLLKKHGISPGYEVPIYYEDNLLGKGLDAVNSYLKQAENQNIFIALKKAYKEMIKK